MILRRVRGRRPTGPRGLFGSRRPAVATDGELAVAQLYRTYHRPLLVFVSRITGGDPHLAEDVVQETMVRACQRMDRLKQETGSLMPWLATVAHRIVVEHQRRRASRSQETGGGQLELLQVPEAFDGLLRS